MDSWDRFLEMRLPPKSVFHKSINNSNISDEDYNHALKSGESSISRTWENTTIFIYLPLIFIYLPMCHFYPMFSMNSDLFSQELTVSIQHTFTRPWTYLASASQIIENCSRAMQ